MKRKMLAVREDLANRLSQMAGRKGLTLYALVNEALTSFLKIEDAGHTTREVMEVTRVLEAARNMGFLLCPEDLWYETVALAHREAGKGVSEGWFEAGARCAKFYSIRGGDDPLTSFKGDLRSLTSNASNLTLHESEEGDVLLVRCINKRFSASYASLYGHFLEGAFSNFGYNCLQRDVAKGALRLKLARRSSVVPDRGPAPIPGERHRTHLSQPR